MPTVEDMFKSGTPARDKYLSRLFGLFSERVVREWCACPQSTYEDIGRPTLWAAGEVRGSTLDFTVRRKATGQTFIAEMKCWPEFENYRYLRLASPSQIASIKGPLAFTRFLAMATNPGAYEVRIAAKPISIEGAILIWSATTDEGRAAAMTQLGFADVLSVESLLADLRSWGSASWAEYVQQLKAWSDCLFAFLTL